MESSRKSLSIDGSPSAVVEAAAACLGRHVKPDDRVAVGLSGGLDSVTLLNVIAALERDPQLRFKVSAIHVNHGISASAERWEAFSRAFCDVLGVPCLCVKVDVERGSRDGLEGAARRARHAVFAGMDTEWIVLAHHRNDQAETMLFNLVRGTGLAGASAMHECNGKLLRPWLSVGRDDIEGYARLHRLEWCDDESNADTGYSRNFLRQNVFPVLKRRFPTAQKNLAAASLRFGESLVMLDDLARLDIGGAEEFPLDGEILARLSEVRARNVLRYLMVCAGVQIPSEARLKEALRQMRDAGSDRHPVMVFGHHQLYRDRGRIYLDPVGDRVDKR